MKRFYKHVAADPSPEGFRIMLDGKPVQTPGRQTLLLPTAALAEAIADEWRAQGEAIEAMSMPMLRLANTAQDGVAANRAEVIAAVLRFGEHDLICYRADNLPELLRRQREAWNPMLDWAAEQLGATLSATDGISHIPQPSSALAALERAVAGFDDYGLVALHVMASITGSLVLALALARSALNSAQAFLLSRLDEAFQAERWGRDAEAEDRASALARELDIAARFLDLSAPDAIDG
jgi:chaperone required for assembly of F1-ATPase